MEIVIEDIEIQEFHQFVRDFCSNYDAHKLAVWLKDHTQKDWHVESKEQKKAEEEVQKGKELVVIEDTVFVDGELAFNKIIIDNDSIFWTAKLNRQKFTKEDTVKKLWPEWTYITNMIGEFYKLNKSFFEEPQQRFRDIYLTKTQNIRLGCKFEKFINPIFAEMLSKNVKAAYNERGLAVTLHPFALEVKVNTTPLPETMQQLSPMQLKSSFTRDDISISVKTYDDYDKMIMAFTSQMPFHDHVKTLLDLAEICRKL